MTRPREMRKRRMWQKVNRCKSHIVAEGSDPVVQYGIESQTPSEETGSKDRIVTRARELPLFIYLQNS